MKNFFILLVGLALLCPKLNAQMPRYKHQAVAFTLVPGLGTNGLDCGKYRNGVAFHLLSGYSGGTEYFEFAGLSNFDKGAVGGVQFAGLVNIVGGNALEFPKKTRRQPKLSEARIAATLKGLQISGLLNAVTGDVEGLQISGGANVNARNTTGIQLAGLTNQSFMNMYGAQVSTVLNYTGKHMRGLQLAGLINSSIETTKGLQVAGLINYAGESMTGIQLTAGLNVANEELFGMQIGLINYARTIKGPYSWPLGGGYGVQIGLINFARNMDGLQLGLINFAGQSHGAHIGLINIFSNQGRTNQRSKPAFGLLNIGSDFHVRASTNELFSMNYSLTSGNGQNHLVKGEYNLYLTQNSLSYSRNFNGMAERNDKPRWAIGYGIEKYIYNPKIGIPSLTKFVNYGIQFHHLSWGKKVEKELSLLTRLRLVAGGMPRGWPVYIYGGLTLNTFVRGHDHSYSPDIGEIARFESGKFRVNTWIGYVIGIHLY